MQNNPLLQPIMSTCTSLLETITQKISVVEGKGVWLQDFWHAEAGTNGTILTLENANIFEKAMAESYSCNNTDCRSAGFTLALHPHHPLVPVWICQLHFYLSEKGTVQYRGNLIQYSYAPAGWMPSEAITSSTDIGSLLLQQLKSELVGPSILQITSSRGADSSQQSTLPELLNKLMRLLMDQYLEIVNELQDKPTDAAMKKAHHQQRLEWNRFLQEEENKANWKPSHSFPKVSREMIYATAND